MRYRHLIPALALLALVLLTGTAFAAIMCSGECTGTNMNDRLIGSPQDDRIFSGAGLRQGAGRRG